MKFKAKSQETCRLPSGFEKQNGSFPQVGNSSNSPKR